MNSFKKEYNLKADAIVTNALVNIITQTDFLITNKDGKTTFQFFDERSDKVDYRTPSEGGVEL